MLSVLNAIFSFLNAGNASLVIREWGARSGSDLVHGDNHFNIRVFPL